ncbi:hypothetical protein Salat_1411500 [Sesamum alatum]|uniref:Uncharacterized protein n=1 Tax=Sesamum alatum TaxID=300844 RepID=A0AAE1YA42_9LAMI|nr:hypothetical protein Salat_1411500 [Sesamum alatum]
MSTKRISKESKFARYMKGPVKALARARDLYVRSLSGCADNVHCVDSMGFPTPHFESLPRSFSTNSSYSNTSRDEDLKGLVRFASARSLTGKVEAELHRSGKPSAVARSRTVVIGRIDEDKPCEFVEDSGGERPGVYPRSRSYVASRRSSMM